MIQSIILQAIGIIIKILRKEKKGYEIFIVDASDKQVVDNILPGSKLLILGDKSIKLDQPSINNLNIGKFGQWDEKIVLQRCITGPMFIVGIYYSGANLFCLKKKTI